MSFVFRSSDTEFWYKSEKDMKLGRGLFHRIGGPAIKGPDFEQWCVNSCLHREDGPAVIFDNGYKEWWIMNEQLTEEEFELYRMKKVLEGWQK